MTETSQHKEPLGPSEDGEPREFLKYTFYKVRPEWRLLAADTKKKQKAEFGALIHDLEEEVTLRCYSLQGIRADTDFMIWAIDPHLETFRDMARRVSSSDLGHYLDTAYGYLATSKRSQYLGGHAHDGQDGARTKHQPLGHRYLFVYPFVKTREWYSIPFEDRQKIMRVVEVINTRHGTTNWMPIDVRMQDNFHRSVAAYKQFDVLMVNAIYDGMNLIAKEAGLINRRNGVLILSENTGAHEELGEHSISVNPFDLEEQSEAIYRALTMPADEKERRAGMIRDTVRNNDIQKWI